MKDFETDRMQAEDYRYYLTSALKSLNTRIKCNCKDMCYDEVADFMYKRAIIAKEIYQLDRMESDEHETENNRGKNQGAKNQVGNVLQHTDMSENGGDESERK